MITRKRKQRKQRRNRNFILETLENRQLLAADMGQGFLVNGPGSTTWQGDFDGDGDHEVLTADSDRYSWNVNDGGGQVQTIAGPDNLNVRWQVVGDFSGDGRDDVARYHQGLWYVGVTTDTSIREIPWGNWAPDLSEPVYVGDVDGDGRDDLIQRNTTANAWRVATGGFASFEETIPDWGGDWNPTRNWQRTFVADFNGDGREDLLSKAEDNVYQLLLSDGSAFYGNPEEWIQGPNLFETVGVGDFDGDGTQELLDWDSAYGGWQQLGFNEFTNDLQVDLLGVTGAGWSMPVYGSVGDANSDGIDDLLYFADTGGWSLASFATGGFQINGGLASLSHLFTLQAAGETSVQPGYVNQTALEHYHDVRNNIKLEHYPGLMKSPEATEQTRSGNAWDQASLLEDKLQTAGINARLAYGPIEAPIQEVMDWLGVQSPQAAIDVLQESIDGEVADEVDANGNITFYHTWVEADIFDADGTIGRAVDPSWVSRDYQLGIGDLITDVPFDKLNYLSHPDGLAANDIWSETVFSFSGVNIPWPDTGPQTVDVDTTFIDAPGFSEDTQVCGEYCGFIMYSHEQINQRFSVGQHAGDHLVVIRPAQVNGNYSWEAYINGSFVHFDPVVGQLDQQLNDRILGYTTFDSLAISDIHLEGYDPILGHALVSVTTEEQNGLVVNDSVSITGVSNNLYNRVGLVRSVNSFANTFEILFSVGQSIIADPNPDPTNARAWHDRFVDATLLEEGMSLIWSNEIESAFDPEEFPEIPSGHSGSDLDFHPDHSFQFEGFAVDGSQFELPPTPITRSPFLMYSDAAGLSRFTGGTYGQFVLVSLNEDNTWSYYRASANDPWDNSFSPDFKDVLVATVDLDARSIEAIDANTQDFGAGEIIGGIQAGYSSGSISLGSNTANILVGGSNFRRHIFEQDLHLARHDLPFEYYSDAVGDYLATQHPGTSLAQVAYDGPNLTERPDRFADIGYDLQNGISYFTSGPAAGLNYNQHVDLEITGIVPMNSPEMLFNDTFLASEVDDYGISIIDGIVSLENGALATLTIPEDVTELSIKVTASAPGTTGSRLYLGSKEAIFTTAHNAEDINESVHKPIVIAFDASQHSEISLAEQRQRMTNNALDISVNETSSVPADDTIAEILSYTGAKFWHEFRTDTDQLFQLGGYVPWRASIGFGIITSQPFVYHRWDLPNPLIPLELEVDMPISIIHGTKNTGEVDQAEYNRLLRIALYNSSALEHEIVQTLSKTHAVSTMKGFQLSTLQDEEVYSFRKLGNNQYQWKEFDEANWSGTVSKNYIKNLVDYPTTFENWVINGLQTNQELHIPASSTHLASWDGAVFMKETFSGGQLTGAAMAIAEDFGVPTSGGESGLWELPTAVTVTDLVETIAVGFEPITYEAFHASDGDPVNLANGNMFREEVDFSIPNTGVPLEFFRRYDAQNKSNKMRLGVGWTHSYGDYLEIDNAHVVWHTSAGEELRFEFSGNVGTAPRNWRGKATRSGFDFTFEDTAGVHHYFSGGYLKYVRDRSGHGVEVHRDSFQRITKIDDVTDNDRFLTVAYGTHGQIATVTRFGAGSTASRRWTYQYQTIGPDKHLKKALAPSAASGTGTVGPTSRGGGTGGGPSAQQVTEYDYYTDEHRRGLMGQITEPDGGTHTYKYYPNGRVMCVTESDGLAGINEYTTTHHFAYNDFRRQTEFIDERGFTTTHDFNQEGASIFITHPDGARERFTWTDDDEPFLQMLSHTDAVNASENYEYYTTHLHDLKQVTARDGIVTEYEYRTTSGRAISNLWKIVTTANDGSGDQLKDEYEFYPADNIADVGLVVGSQLGNVKKINRAVGTPDYAVTEFHYQEIFNLSGMDFEKGLLDYRIDARGFEPGEQPEEFTTYFTYNPAGQVTQVAHDVTDDGALRTVYPERATYKDDGSPLTRTDGYGVVIRFETDQLGRIRETSLPDPYNLGGVNEIISNFVYNEETGRMIQSTDVLGLTSFYAVDYKGRIRETATAGGTTSYSDYDAAGNMASSRDELNQETQFIYDSRNRLIQSILPDGSTRRWRYDGEGRAVAVTDGNGNQTSTTFDPVGRVITTTDAFGQTTTNEYADGFGNLSRTTDARGFTTEFKYDARHRLSETRVQSEDAVDGFEWYTFDYDDHGNLTRTVQYDTYQLLGTSPAPMTVDGDPRVLIDQGMPEHWFHITETTYDQLDRPVQVVDAEGGVSITEYLAAADNVQWQQDQEGRVTKFYYDYVGRLRVQRATDGTDEYATEHVLNDAGQTLRILEGPWDQSCLCADAARETRFTYDKHGRETSRTDAEINDWRTVTDAAGRIVATIDPLNQVTHQVFDPLGRVLRDSSADPDGDGLQLPSASQYKYDGQGNLIESIDPRGNTTVYGYDRLNRSTDEFLPLGEDYRDNFGSYSNPKLSMTAGPNAYQYDFVDIEPGYYQVDVTWSGDDDFLAPDAAVEFYDLDGVSDPLVSVGTLNQNVDPTDHHHNQDWVRFDEGIFVSSDTLRVVVRGDGDAPLSRPTFMIRRLGTLPAVHTSYDVTGNVVSTSIPRQTDDGNNFAYEDHYQTSTWELDGLGRVVRALDEDPDGSSTTWIRPEFTTVYDSFGNVAYTQEATGPGEVRTTSFYYDRLNRLEFEVLPDPDGSGSGNFLFPLITNFEYDAVSNLTHTTEVWGHPVFPSREVTTFTVFDDLNRPIEVHRDYSGQDQLTEYEYDQWDNVRTELFHHTDDTLSRNTYRYDRLNRTLRHQTFTPTDEETYTRIYNYDGAGNLTRDTTLLDGASLGWNNGQYFVSSGEAQVTSFAYDRMNRQIAVSDPNSQNRDAADISSRDHTTFYAYDPSSNMARVEDANGNATTFEYDSVDRMILETNATGVPRTYHYDASGNTLSMTDRRGWKTRYVRDYLGRVLIEQWSTPTEGMVRNEYTLYDDLGRVVRTTVRNGNNADVLNDRIFEYDNWDRIKLDQQLGRQESVVDAPRFSNRFIYNYTHPGDYRVKEYYSGGTHRAMTYYTFDALGQLDQIEVDKSTVNHLSTVEKVVDFTFDGLGNVKQIKRQLGEVFVPGGLSVTTNFTYDAMKRVTDIVHWSNSERRHTIDYDRANRIEDVTHKKVDGGSPDIDVSDYDYDLAGQVTDADHTNGPDEDWDYDENGNREGSGYVVGIDNRVINDGTYSYDYDAEGNISQRTLNNNSSIRSTYEWDHRNRLTTVTHHQAKGQSTTIDYKYNAQNERVQKEVFNAGGNLVAKENYIYRDGNLTLVMEPRDLQDINAVDDLTHRYLHTDAVDQAIADDMFNATGYPEDSVWLLADQVGSIRSVVDATTRNVIQDLEYGAFGNTTNIDGTGYESFIRFTGREWDNDAQLYNYRARWYDPNLGRFISSDPLGFDGGDANLYRYVGNNPIANTDPSGLVREESFPTHQLGQIPGTSYEVTFMPSLEDRISENLRQAPNYAFAVVSDADLLSSMPPALSAATASIPHARQEQARVEAKPQLQTVSDIQALYGQSQQIVNRISKANPNDNRLLFLDTQQTILAELSKGKINGTAMTPAEVDWLSRVLHRFMGSLNNAVNGKIQPGPGASKEVLIQGLADRRAGKVGGAWWSQALPLAQNAQQITAGNDTWLGKVFRKKGMGLTPNPQEAAAVIMATAHIHFDLKMALMEEGVGTDRVWNYIGTVVERSAKKHGRGLTNWLNGQMPRFSNLDKIDPLIMRNEMRSDVKKYFDFLRRTDQWTNTNPFVGLSGTDLILN